MAIDPIKLTRQLVDIESTTYFEGPAGHFLADYLGGLGYEIEKTPVQQTELANTEAGKSERFNVYACEAGVTPDIVFSTHMDTVPPFFPSSEDEENIYGRGSCDAKGIAACQIAAAEILRAEGYKIGLLYVVGEERDSAGAKAANLNPKGSKFLINGEPTDNFLATATKGALRIELRAKGKMAHSAYPELGDSAIEKLLDVLDDIREIKLPEEPEIGPATLNIGLISGGRAPNVIPDAAEAHILVRLVGPDTEVKDLINNVVGDRCDVKYTLHLPFVKMRKLDAGLPMKVVKYATDIPQLTNWGEPFLLGPGSIHVAHTPDEKISKKELLDCVQLYIQVTKQLLGA